jgi:HK97 family phage major capsid protein
VKTIPELNVEIKTLMDEATAILEKHGGLLTESASNEDHRRVQEIKTTVLTREVERDARVAAEGDASFFKSGSARYATASTAHASPTAREYRDLAGAVMASDEYTRALKSGELSQPRPSLVVPLPRDISLSYEAKRASWATKALVTSADPGGGSFVTPDRLGDVTPYTRGELAFLDVLPTISTSSDLVEWVEQTGRTNNAAAVAEATASSGVTGAKPESAVAYAVRQGGVETIATHIPITTRILQDAPMLDSTIRDELLYMVRETLESQAIIGNGASPNLQGINSAANIQTGAAGANPADAIFHAAMQVRFVGGVPATVAVLNQAGYEAIRLMRENAASGTYGNYLFGPPSQAAPLTIFGLTVALAQSVPANTAFVLNATATTLALVERMGAAILTGWINDQFTRNMLTLLAEGRWLMIYRRPKGIYKLTGMP